MYTGWLKRSCDSTRLCVYMLHSPPKHNLCWSDRRYSWIDGVPILNTAERLVRRGIDSSANTAAKEVFLTFYFKSCEICHNCIEGIQLNVPVSWHHSSGQRDVSCVNNNDDRKGEHAVWGHVQISDLGLKHEDLCRSCICVVSTKLIRSLFAPIIELNDCSVM